MESSRIAAARLVRDLISDRTGITFDEYNMDILLDKLSPLMIERGIDSLIDYYYALKYDESGSEWGHVLNAVSVRETFFWREFDQIRALVDVVVPQLAASRQPLRIWSAACAS